MKVVSLNSHTGVQLSELMVCMCENRQSHAEVEQRRRVRVAQHTEDLGRALPTVGEKQDKLTILKQTCVTLRRLRTSRRRKSCCCLLIQVSLATAV